MAKRMLIFDFDDTLFSHAVKRVPQSAAEALRRLVGNGELVVLATGRAPDSCAFIRGELPVSFEWMIALNGQLIYHNDELVYERFITLPSIREVYQIARENGFACGGYFKGGSLVSVLNERVKAVWSEFGAPPPLVVPDFSARFALYQAHLYITREEAERYFSRQLRDYVTNWSHPTLLNLISKETGKAKGIAWLMDTLGVDRANTFAFGDGFNDLDMLRAVAHPVAMGNASPELKCAAEFVTGAPEDDGIVRALAHYGLL